MTAPGKPADRRGVPPSRLNLRITYLGVVYAVVGVTLLLLVRVLGLWS
jgi:hypothetical protein